MPYLVSIGRNSRPPGQLPLLSESGTQYQALSGSSSSFRLPITDDLMLVIWQSLDLRLPDHLGYSGLTCSLGYFGFLRASEFTVPSLASFSPSYHLGFQPLQWIPHLHPPACV